jgi:hypothetical protein
LCLELLLEFAHHELQVGGSGDREFARRLLGRCSARNDTNQQCHRERMKYGTAAFLHDRNCTAHASHYLARL